MKRAKQTILALAAVFAAAFARADVTNYVYTVSNIYIRVFETREVTNKVKNTHYNYYYTNNVTTITNIWTINHTTNFHYDVVWDNFGPWIEAASNQANRAASSAADASGFATQAAGHATSAGSYNSSARTYAGNASASATAAQRAADAGLSNINARIAWFDAHAGETITMVTTNINVSITTNIDMNVLNYPYTAPNGTTYNNILYYTYGNANGKVCATPPSNVAPGTSWVLYLYNSNSSQYSATMTFYYDVGYISSNEEGMLIRFVPRNKQLEKNVFESTTRYFLPRDFYWQAGSYVAVFDIYNSATNYVGRWSRTIQRSFPDMYNGTYNDTYTGDLYTLQLTTQKEHSGYSGFPYSSSTTRLKMRTPYGCYLSNGTPLWIPDAPSAEQAEVIEWLSNFPH